jgi:hypothetical protein
MHINEVEDEASYENAERGAMPLDEERRIEAIM